MVGCPQRSVLFSHDAVCFLSCVIPFSSEQVGGSLPLLTLLYHVARCSTLAQRGRTSVPLLFDCRSAIRLRSVDSTPERWHPNSPRPGIDYQVTRSTRSRER